MSALYPTPQAFGFRNYNGILIRTFPNHIEWNNRPYPSLSALDAHIREINKKWEQSINKEGLNKNIRP